MIYTLPNDHPMNCRWSIDLSQIGRHTAAPDSAAPQLDQVLRHRVTARGLEALAVSLLNRVAWIGRPMRWLFRVAADPRPATVWGPPKVKQIMSVFDRHGAYFLHGTQGSGKSMGSVALGLVIAAEMAKEEKHQGEDVTVFVNLTVRQHAARLYLASLGYGPSVIRRVKVQGYSLMSPHALGLMRTRRSVWVADELGYYMEDDKKAVRGVILKAIRMARRRQQIWLCANQEILHSRYRPLFRARGECSMRFGCLSIAWRGAQDIVDARKPTKPYARIRYGLDVRKVAPIYDTWEDLEDITDEEQLAA